MQTKRSNGWWYDGWDDGEGQAERWDGGKEETAGGGEGLKGGGGGYGDLEQSHTHMESEGGSRAEVNKQALGCPTTQLTGASCMSGWHPQFIS